MTVRPLALEFATTVVGIITAIGTLLTAAALVITAIAALKRVGRVEKVVGEVHTIVNQQRTDSLNYQRALVRALNDAGIPVPMDQSASGPDDPHNPVASATGSAG